MTTYKELLNDLGQISMNHNQIKSFGYGDLSQITNDIDTKLEPEYVRLYIIPGSTVFDAGSIQYNLSIIICDKIKDDLSNQVEVLSDTLEISKDIFTILNNSYSLEFGEFTNYYNPEFGSVVTPFLERFETILAGWTLNISITQPYNFDSCIVPITGLTLPTNVMDVNYKQIVGDILQIGELHSQINSAGFGDLPQITNDITTDVAPLYPKLYIVPNPVTLLENELQHNFNITLSDKLKLDYSNQRDVMNDMLELCKDVFVILNTSEYYAQFTVECTPFLERFDDVLAGWSMDIILSTPYEYSYCEVPTETLDLPEDVYNVNYNQIVNDVINIGRQHNQLNSVGFGDVPQLTNDILTQVSPLYPKMYVVPDIMTLDNGQLIYNFNIIISDKLLPDLSNQLDVMSDTLEITKDIFTILMNSEYYTDFGVNCSPFLERFDEVLGGWTINVQLFTPYQYNRCDVPVERFDHKKWYQVDEIWNQINKLWKNM